MEERMKHVTTHDGQVRFCYTWPLDKRIEESQRMVMSIPAGEMLERGGDEDLFICDALREAQEELTRLRAALEHEAESHEALALVSDDLARDTVPLLAQYHREHAAVLRGALAGKGEEQAKGAPNDR
jgi:hypothetical protein